MRTTIIAKLWYLSKFFPKNRPFCLRCTALDVATNVRIVHLTAMHALHVTKKTETRWYCLNASGKRNEKENGNKTERSGNGLTVLTTCNGNKTGTIFLHMYPTCPYYLVDIVSWQGFLQGGPEISPSHISCQKIFCMIKLDIL